MLMPHDIDPPQITNPNIYMDTCHQDLSTVRVLNLAVF